MNISPCKRSNSRQTVIVASDELPGYAELSLETSVAAETGGI